MNKFRVVPYNDQAQIDLSPMLDVVFIMLIFFIVVASFVKESGLPVNLPDSTSQPPDQNVESNQVVVAANSEYTINGRGVAPGNVRDYVQALHAENAEASFAVILKPGSIVRDAALAMDAGRSIGVDVVPIVAID